MSMTRELFIQSIADAVKVLAPKYGICVVSPIVAQACLETGYGVGKGAEVKVSHHNYFGLKYRANRVSCHNGYFNDKSVEQNKDGSYTPIQTDWYSFPDLFSGVEGYFQFTNIANYANLKGVTDPFEYCRLVREDNYATDLEYVSKLTSIINQNELQRYDAELNGGAVMGYTNSPLAVYKKLSPNHSGQRTHKIDRLTPHCVVGQLSAESIADCFPSGREASCNYGIGFDGRISLIVEEKNRSWCSSSSANDQRALTFEVASDKTAPYAFNNEAYQALINLSIDCCRRNGIKRVLWFGDKDKSLAYEPEDGEAVITSHRWFAAKACPGDWLYDRMNQFAAAVNKGLGNNAEAEKPAEKPSTDGKLLYRVQCGAYKVKSNVDIQLTKVKNCGIDAFITQVDGLYKVQVGAYSVKANADAQLAKMKKLGFDCFITTVTRESESFIPRKSAEEIAKEIWTGKCSDSRWDTWGTGETRKQRLETAGYNYDAVQKAIKQLYG